MLSWTRATGAGTASFTVVVRYSWDMWRLRCVIVRDVFGSPGTRDDGVALDFDTGHLIRRRGECVTKGRSRRFGLGDPDRIA